MRSVVRAVLLCASVASVAPLSLAVAQSNEERVANDVYARTHDYDLVHQRIEVRSFDWDSTSFDGRVTTALVALRPALDSVILDAGKLLQIARVADARGATLRFAAHGDTLVIYPAQPLAFRDTLRFTIEYHARIENGRGLTFITPEGRAHRPQQIWSQGEDHDNHLWFPTYDFPNDKMTWELLATVPAEYAVVSNGRLVSDRSGPGGLHTVAWRQDQPSATYLVSLIVAPLVRLSDAWRRIPVDYYVYRSDSARAGRLFRVTPDMIDVYSRLTGLSYPWAKYAQTTVADFFGGMENVSATTLVDWLPDDRAYLDRPWYQWILIPHELSHQWFGDYVTTEDWANFWLNEGFAEFMPGQYWGAKLGPHAADDYYLDEYRQYLQIDARRRMPLAALASNNIYPKGALVLRMLLRYLGPERFWAGIRRYLSDNAFGSATTDDLREAFLRATGENLAWFWDEWMYKAGHPRFTVTTTYDSLARKLTLAVKQTQVDSGQADSAGLRYETPSVFRMPLAIRVGTASGDVIRRVALDARDQMIEIPGLPGAPTMVVFDDGNAVLKELTFEQPTAWLATELRRDADLWNRQWVIEQLGKRAGDTAAAAALTWAATSADYLLTRAGAAEALGQFPAGLAQAPLEAALRDTSAQVRRAAVSSLGEVAGQRAVELARATFRDDSSYEVRAAALLALVSADSTAARQAISWGLETPSYQDVIRDAALRMVAQTGDTTWFAQLEAMAGAERLPLHVLGALANRGSATALHLLVAHLDDNRRYVRRWALEAFRFTVHPDLAREALTPVADRLKYAETRRAVADALEQLKKHEPGS